MTVWGSCSPKNDIAISLRLLFLENKFLDYVIVHELAHTKVKSHSKRFWKIVSDYIPDYKAFRKELRAKGREIVTGFDMIKDFENNDSISTEQKLENTLPQKEKEMAAKPETGQRSMTDYFG